MDRHDDGGPRLLADHAVDHQAVRPLEGSHGGIGLRTEKAIHGESRTVGIEQVLQRADGHQRPQVVGTLPKHGPGVVLADDRSRDSRDPRAVTAWRRCNATRVLNYVTDSPDGDTTRTLQNSIPSSAGDTLPVYAPRGELGLLKASRQHRSLNPGARRILSYVRPAYRAQLPPERLVVATALLV